MTYCDSHLHLSKCSDFPRFSQDESHLCVSSCHTQEDFDFFGATADKRRSGFSGFRYRSIPSLRFGTANAAPPIPCAFASFGIHPQAVNPTYMKNHFAQNIAFLELLLAEQKIVAVGECGFDFFTSEYKSTTHEQEIAFEKQLFLSIKYGVPIVLHLRKSIEKIFTYTRYLKKLPAVIFHSFPGTLREAQSLTNHGLNAFFSFGKPLLNGKKSALDCATNLPIQNLLLETDAPYQTLKGETETFPHEIKRVYEKACELRNIRMEELCEAIERNFRRAFFAI